jgi:hypothetical protein
MAELGGGAVSAQSLSHIPFRLRDELMILGMARWMKFIGAVKVVGGLLLSFLVLVGLIFVGSALSSRMPAMGKTGQLIDENKITFISLGFFALLLAVAGTWLGFVLYQAAEDFERVVRSDVADQDYITAGLIQLKTYFKVSILLALAGVLVALTAGISLAVKIGVAS